jgi:hypothetical protein
MHIFFFIFLFNSTRIIVHRAQKSFENLVARQIFWLPKKETQIYKGVGHAENLESWARLIS